MGISATQVTQLVAARLPVTVYTSLRAGLEGVDVVNVLRLQLERQTRALFPTAREYSRLFGVSAEALCVAKTDVLVMHPGPMNRGWKSARRWPTRPRP